ncbi:hypothetical protein [Streptomyces sp. NPDC089799]|uniref:hypothetical protein n=1 Tax=Streptomyces sp. NPDC089799 TaxID=3155066 RepID=UPI0034159230
MVIVLILALGAALYGLLRHQYLGYGSAVVAVLLGFLIGCTEAREPVLYAITELVRAIPTQ